MSTGNSPRKTRSPSAAPGIVMVPTAEYEALVARARETTRARLAAALGISVEQLPVRQRRRGE